MGLLTFYEGCWIFLCLLTVAWAKEGVEAQTAALQGRGDHDELSRHLHLCGRGAVPFWVVVWIFAWRVEVILFDKGVIVVFPFWRRKLLKHVRHLISSVKDQKFSSCHFTQRLCEIPLRKENRRSPRKNKTRKKNNQLKNSLEKKKMCKRSAFWKSQDKVVNLPKGPASKGSQPFCWGPGRPFSFVGWFLAMFSLIWWFGPSQKEVMLGFWGNYTWTPPPETGLLVYRKNLQNNTI